MKPSIVPDNLTGKALYDFLVKNEALIFHAKKSEIKKADSVAYASLYVDEKGQMVSKADLGQTQTDPTKLKVAVVINTTNWFDSHGDVHIPGLWKKSLSDNKKTGYYLLDSHGRNFRDVIAEGCQGNTKPLSWKDLGLDLPGVTEALIFNGLIEKDRNEYMFGQYQKGYVKKHSVGMRYIKMVTCIDDEDYAVQKENWDKYIEMVANRKEAEDSGYFWAVLEAGIMEGSAALFASNTVTPTMEVVDYDSTKTQPATATDDQPQEDHDQQNKSMTVCPSCNMFFYAPQDGSVNCTNCGQYVSRQSNSLEVPTFDLIKAIAETTFITI